MNAVARSAESLWLSSRVALAMATYCVVALLRPAVLQSALPLDRADAKVSLAALAAHWYRFDAKFFAEIAAHGYTRLPDAAFFPLFPLATRLATLGVLPVPLAAAVVSNLATLAALIGLAYLARHEGFVTDARDAVRALLLFPLAFFLAAGYSDSLFLALAVWTLYALRTARWPLAVALLFLAGATRVTAVALIAPAAYEFAAQIGLVAAFRGHQWAKLRARLAQPLLIIGGALALAVPFAIALFALYLRLRFGDPLAFAHVEGSTFARQISGPWTTIGQSIGQVAQAPSTFVQARILLDLLPLAIVIAGALLAVRRLPVSFTLYSAGLLLLILTTPVRSTASSFPEALVSAGRYGLAAVPSWLALGGHLRRHRELDAAYTLGCGLLQALALAVFVGGGWLV